MIHILFFGLVVLTLACQSSPKRQVSSEESSTIVAAENQLDPKFEEFEGGSFESEKAIHDQLIFFAKGLMTRMHAEANSKNNSNLENQASPMTRDAHAKSHGCLKAKFEVDPSQLPPVFRKGLFAETKSYEAWVRYSNNDHLPIRVDNEYDLRGVAIKVMNVPGRKIMTGSEEALTQDFLLYGSSVFFIKDNKNYIEFMKGLRDEQAAKALITSQPRAAVATRLAQFNMRNYTNPLGMPFFSAVPVRLGLPEDPDRTAFKYAIKPCGQQKLLSPISKKDPNYLRKNLKATLEKSEACLEFQVQTQVNPRGEMPVEDSTVDWPQTPNEFSLNAISPYRKVATVRIFKQNFDTPERNQYCENLSFTPWHSLIEHKPLGRTMRMRRDLYKATSEYRRQMNRAPLAEPAGFEIE